MADSTIRTTLQMTGNAIEDIAVGGPNSAAPQSLVEAAAPPGVIVAYGGASPPTGWVLCGGQAISRTTYASLFAAIGTAYGVGDGSTTFNVPDLRGRFPLGKTGVGTGSTLGETGGTLNHEHEINGVLTDSESAHTHGVGSLAAANEAAHTHSFTPNTDTAETPVVTPKNVGDDTAAVTGAGSAHTHALSGSTAAGSAHSHSFTTVTEIANPPFQVINYLIKT
jgi:microcystin-dependent protein